MGEVNVHLYTTVSLHFWWLLTSALMQILFADASRESQRSKHQNWFWKGVSLKNNAGMLSLKPMTHRKCLCRKGLECHCPEMVFVGTSLDWTGNLLSTPPPPPPTPNTQIHSVLLRVTTYNAWHSWTLWEQRATEAPQDDCSLPWWGQVPVRVGSWTVLNQTVTNT